MLRIGVPRSEKRIGVPLKKGCGRLRGTVYSELESEGGTRAKVSRAGKLLGNGTGHRVEAFC